MNQKAVLAIWTHTFKDAIRTKWLLMFSAVFFLLAVNIPMLVLIAVRYIPPDYLEIYLNYLVTLSFPFLPLLALPIGASSVVEERESGSLQYVLANPISKGDFIIGKTLGLLLATSMVVAVGYGAASLLAFSASLGKYVALGEIILVAVALNAIMVALSLLISTISRRRATALGLAIFIWFTFAILSDLGFLTLVVNLRSGPASVIPLILSNPIEVTRILAVISFHGTSEQLGTTGIILTNVLGPLTLPTMVGTLCTWAIVTYSLSFLLFRRQDV